MKLHLDPYEVFCRYATLSEKGFFLDRWGDGRYTIMGFDPIWALEGSASEWKPAQGEIHKVAGIYTFALLGYDLALALEELPSKCEEGMQMPDFILQKYTKIARYDHYSKEWEWHGNWQILPVEKADLRGYAGLRKDFVKKEQYEKWVEECKNLIYEGDLFQANLSHPLLFEIIGNPLGLYKRIRDYNPSPYAGVYFDKNANLFVLSNSPELLYQTKGRQILTKPIAGTRRRGKDAEEEERFIAELRDFAKEQAEHLMLVDLERNDLGRICEYGSVVVSEFGAVETYKNVFHLVSTVKGVLREEVDFGQIIQAVFPGGTITGAPKIRSMEVISDFEVFQRGFYTGSMGFIEPNGDAQFNILIRTAQIKNQKMQLSFGAGIVFDSEPQAEYKETLNKAAAWIKMLDGEWK